MQSSAAEAANTPGHANSSHSIRKVGASSFLSCNPLENYSFGPKIEESVGVLIKIVMFLGFSTMDFVPLNSSLYAVQLHSTSVRKCQMPTPSTLGTKLLQDVKL